MKSHHKIESGFGRLPLLLGLMVVLGVVLGVVFLTRNNRTGNPDAIQARARTSRPEPVDIALPEPCFHYFNTIDRQLIAQRIAKAQAPFQMLPRPDGMADDVFAICESLLNDDVSLKELCQIKISETGAIRDAGFLKDGEYLVTLSDKLKVWRVSTGELLRNHTLPLRECRKLLLGKSPSSATLVGSHEIVQCSLVDGSVTARCKVVQGIQSACRATEAGHIGICTEDKGWWLISQDLKSRIECPDVKLSSPRIAVHPSGKWLLGNHVEGMVRWQVNPSKVEYLGKEHYDPASAIPLCSQTHDRWISAHLINEFRDGARTEPVAEAQGRPFLIHSPIVNAFSCTSDTPDESMLLVLGGKSSVDPSLRVLDLDPFQEAASKPVVVSRQPTAKIFANSRADRLAIQSNDGIRVVKRRPWVEHTGTMFANRMVPIFLEARFEQLELFGEYLRQFSRFPCGQSGEEMYERLVNHLAEAWQDCEALPFRSELLKRADEWLESGSTLALTVSAARHKRVAFVARGTGFASDVSEENWKAFRQRNQYALKDLSRLPNDVHRPAAVYRMLVELARDMNGDYADAEELLKDYTLEYPLEIYAHIDACIWSLPRWGGEESQLGAYVKALSAIYPPEISDFMYARLASYVSGSIRELETGEFALDVPRVLKALEALADNGSATIEDLEFGMIFAKIHDDPLVTSKLAQRHLKQFELPRRRAYYQGVINELVHWRNVWQLPPEATGSDVVRPGEVLP